MSSKRRVIQFVRYWVDVIKETVFEDSVVDAFVDDLYEMVRMDDKKYGTLDEELRMIAKVHGEKQRFFDREQQKSVQKWKSSTGQIQQLADNGSQEIDLNDRHLGMKAKDEIIFRVYCADHTYTTIKTTIGATAESVKQMTADKTSLKGNLVLVEVKSNGDKNVLNDADVSVPTLLTINGRIFVAPTSQVESLLPIREQEGPSQSSQTKLEELGSRELAFELTLYDWDLFSCIHEYELIYQVFGRHNFKRITSNLDVFLRRFNEVQFWVVTEMCLSGTIGKRVQTLRKFLKIADYCREYQNMNSFFAIVMGLSNVAVSKMTSTWDRVSSKVRRQFNEFEAIIDPSRNHRAYRLAVLKMSPPIIPFMPLLMKDMTFAHEGNKTNKDGLVNFEKMHMIAHSIRTMQHFRSEPFYLDPPSSVKNEQEARKYIRNLKVIDNQKRFTQLSSKR
ncbi:RAPGEF4 (predicted) [Pycnogonum litorale]